MIRRFFFGFSFFILGFRQLRSQKNLWHLILIPIVINVSFFSVGIYYSWPHLPSFVKAVLGFVFQSTDGWFYQLVYYPLFVIFGLAFLVGISAMVFLLSSLVASPFNSLLSEKVLSQMKALQDRPFHWLQFAKNSLWALFVSINRLIILIGVGLILFVLSFAPGLNFIAVFLTFVLLAFDTSDYALENLQLDLRGRINFLKTQFVEYCGMGAFLGLLMLIPGLISLCMPVLVIGSTLVVAKRRLDDSRSNS